MAALSQAENMDTAGTDRKAPRPHVGTVGQNTIDKLRMHCGLSRANAWDLMLALGRARGGDEASGGAPLEDGSGQGLPKGEAPYKRTTMYHMWNRDDADIPSWAVERMRFIADAHSRWQRQLLEKAETFGERPGHFTTHELAQLLDMTDYYVFEMRFNGTLGYTRRGRMLVYDMQNVRDLLELCTHWLEDGGRPVMRGKPNTGKRGHGCPLAHPFMRWFRRQLATLPPGDGTAAEGQQ